MTLSSRLIQVEVNPETGGIHFFDSSGQRLLTDKDYGTQFTPFNDAGVPSFNVRQAFLLDKDEVIYGLGQQQTGKVNQRNQKLFLRNQNMSICIPFIHSVKGYALYWDNYSPTTFLEFQFSLHPQYCQSWMIPSSGTFSSRYLSTTSQSSSGLL